MSLNRPTIDMSNIKDVTTLSKHFNSGEIDSEQVTSFLKNPDFHRKIIYNYNTLLFAAKELPEHKEVLIRPFLNDATLYNNIIKVGYNSNLVELAKMFPDQAEALIRFPDTHENATRVVEYFHQLKDTAKELPEYKAALIQPFLNDVTLYNRIIKVAYNSNLIELAQMFPDQAEALIRFPDTHENATRVIEYFTHLINAANALPEHKAALIQPFLNDATLYNRIIKVGYDSKLVELVKMFPDQAEALINFPDTHEKAARAIEYFTTLINAANALPEHKAALIQPFLNDATLYNRIIKVGYDSKLVELVKMFPDQAEALINFPDTNVEATRVLDSLSRLITTARDLPEHKAALIKPFLNNVALYNSIIRINYYDTSNFLALIAAFPEHLEALLTFPDKHPDENCLLPIKMYPELVNAAAELHEQKDMLINLCLNSKKISSAIFTTLSSLESLVTAFPAYKDTLVNFVINNADICRNILFTHDAKLRFARTYPEYKNALILALFNDPARFETFFGTISWMNKAADIFPDYKEALSQTEFKLALETFNNRKAEVVRPEPIIVTNSCLTPTAVVQLTPVVELTPIVVKTTPIVVKTTPIAVKTTPIAVKTTPIEIKTTPVVAKPAHVEINPSPEKPQTTSSASSPLGLFNTTVKDPGKQAIENVREQMFKAASHAVYEYLSWYATGVSYRGKSGKLAFWNHQDNGRQAAEKLGQDIEGADYGRLQDLIGNILQNSYFKNHSLGSFLMDELLDRGVTLWDEKKYPGYKRKYPNEVKVANITSNNTNGKK